MLYVITSHIPFCCSNIAPLIIQVGGSLASLFTSTLLRRLSHNVTILERNPTPLLQNQGAGVVAGGETQAFFHRHDLFQRPLAVTSRRRLYLDKSGDVIDEEDSVQKMTSWDLLYFLLRANCDGVESRYLDAEQKVGERIKKGTEEEGWGRVQYVYGRKVVEVSEKGEKVEIRTENTAEGEGEGRETLSADMVLAADGQSSTIRRLLMPDAPQRTYAGYVAFRGTVPENEVSDAATKTFVEKFCFFHGPHTQILAYTIPGPEGTLNKGQRLVNWVWYCNYPEDSEEFKDLMTDADGQHHHYTLPVGKMSAAIWEKQIQRAKDTLPPQFAELVHKTKQPFVQAITDVEPPEAGPDVMGGKVVFVGDALAGFRPHTAASTSQAAFDALMLDGYMKGEIGREEWREKVMGYAREVQRHGVMLGERSQFGRHPLER